MKKGLLSAVALLATVVGTAALTSCGPKTPDTWKVDDTGSVLHIRAWNDEFKRFFEKYVSKEKVDSKIKGEDGKDIANPTAPNNYHYVTKDGKELTVKWTIVPSDDAAYQKAVDTAVKNQAEAKADDKVDMFLAEADYIEKYSASDYTQDIKPLGVTDFSNTYKYTVQAASDKNGIVKGVSFQCCPSALIYNRVIARDVFGTDDPAEVQKKVSSWSEFNKTAAEMKAKDYLMTASVEDSYRVFSNNAKEPWVKNNKVQIPGVVTEWMNQADLFIKNGYTSNCGVWDDEKTANIKADENKAFCCFGPAWYYNFCMGGSKAGDWAICEGPQAHFWGGTWLLAAAGSDNTTAVAEIMDAFINNKEVCKKLIDNDGQFTNNQAVNKAAADEGKGNAFLGGQNDTALFLELAKNIKFENTTIYDQTCNEKIQKYYREHLSGEVKTREEAINNFYTHIKSSFANLVVPTK